MSVPAPVALDGGTGEAAPTRGLVRETSIRGIGLDFALAALGFVLLCSIAIGSKPISFGTVFEALLDYDATVNNHLIVRTLRVPRTIVGLLAGAALGASGALMQGVARNPRPGLTHDVVVGEIGER